MSFEPAMSRARTMHARKGAISNRFEYGLDCVLIDPSEENYPALFGRNQRKPLHVSDKDFGSKEVETSPVDWATNIFAEAGLTDDYTLRLVTQPRVMGTLFNPVSFWMALRGDDIVAMIAEVNNTFGGRHFYVVHHPDFRPIAPEDSITANKIFYVSPFQDIAGEYSFQVRFDEKRFSIKINYENGDEGLLATLWGDWKPMSNARLARVASLRALGGLRIKTLIYYQALKLKLKGAKYRKHTKQTIQEVSS